MSFSKNISLIALFSIASVVTSLIYTIAMANLFGVGRQIEIFFAASQVFTVIVSLTQAGQLTEAFIPIFHKIKVDVTLEAAYDAFSVMLNWITLLALTLSAVIAIFSMAFVTILVPGFAIEEKIQTAQMVMIFAPLIVLQVAMSFMKAIAHAQSLFGWPEAVALAGSFIQLAILLVFYEAGILALVGGLIMGVTLQFIGISIVLWRNGFRHKVIFVSNDFAVATIFKRLFSTSAYTIAAQMFSVIMTAVLSNLPQGTFAAYSYALRMQSKIGSVLLRPISIVFFTRFSEAYALGSDQLRALAKMALSRTLLLIAFAIMVMVTSAERIMRGILASEEFPIHMVDLTTVLLSVFVFTFLFTGVGQIARKSAVAIGQFDIQYYGFCGSQLLLAFLAWNIIPLYGFFGIIVVIVMSRFLPFCISTLVLVVARRDLFAFYDLRLLAKWLTTLIFSVAVASTFSDMAWRANNVTRLSDVIVGVQIFLMAMLAFVLAASMLKIEEFKLFFIGLHQKRKRL